MRAVKFAVCSPIAKLVYLWIIAAGLAIIPYVVYHGSYDAYMHTFEPKNNPNCAPLHTRECNARWNAYMWACLSLPLMMVFMAILILIVCTCEKCIGCHADAIRATRQQWIDENAKKNE